MKLQMKRAAALLLGLVLCLGLAGCGNKAEETGGMTSEDAMLYVNGLLKMTYLGEYDPDYLDLVGSSEREAEAYYQTSLAVEADRFLSLYEIEYPSDKYNQKLLELYKDIYSHAKFEVVSAAGQEDGSFSVKVAVEPINTVRLVKDATNAAVEEFRKKYPAEIQSTMSEDEYKEMDAEWAEMILELYQSKLEETENLSAQPVVVQLEKNDQGHYTITKEDFKRIDELILDYGI